MEFIIILSTNPSEKNRNSNQPREEKTRLPDNFTPGPYTVLIGRGKACADALGNKRLKVIVSNYLDEYSNAPNRISRSIIVSKIVDIVREACPVGSFVKQEDGAWWEVSDLMARERVGSMLRDSLHEHYKSSSKSKLARRKSSTVNTKEGKQEVMKKAPPSSPPPSSNPTPAPAISSGDVHKGTSSKSIRGLGDIYAARRSSAMDLNPTDEEEKLTRIDAAEVLSRKLPSQSFQVNSFEKERDDFKSRSKRRCYF